MKILIIEDDPFKKKDIEVCLRQHFNDVIIDSASAYASGVRSAIRGNHDVVIIDNGLPFYDSSPTDLQPDMARNILEEITDMSKPPRSIVCSAFDPGTKESYFDQLVKQYECCTGYVRYAGNETMWESELVNLIEKDTNK